MKKLLNKTLIISFDSDYKEDVKQYSYILELLKKHGFKTSWAVIGKLIKKFPEEHKKLVEEGHEIINHSFSHPEKFKELTKEEMIKEVYKGGLSIKKVLGVNPIGFRIPHFGNNFTFKIYKILTNLKYKYDSSAICLSIIRTKPYEKKDIIEFPVSTCPEHIFTAFDTWHSFRSKNPSHTPKKFLVLFERMLKKRNYINIYLDPQDCIKFDFERMLELIKEYGWKVKTYAEFFNEFKKQELDNSQDIVEEQT